MLMMVVIPKILPQMTLLVSIYQNMLLLLPVAALLMDHHAQLKANVMIIVIL